MAARLSPLTLNASEASYRQVKKPIYSFTFHISLLSARLAPHSKQLQRRESHQTIRSCPKNCTDPTARNVQSHLVSVPRNALQLHVVPVTCVHVTTVWKPSCYFHLLLHAAYSCVLLNMYSTTMFNGAASCLTLHVSVYLFRGTLGNGSCL